MTGIDRQNQLHELKKNMASLADRYIAQNPLLEQKIVSDLKEFCGLPVPAGTDDYLLLESKANILSTEWMRLGSTKPR